jgi:hypothetical protein
MVAVACVNRCPSFSVWALAAPDISYIMAVASSSAQLTGEQKDKENKKFAEHDECICEDVNGIIWWLGVRMNLL